MLEAQSVNPRPTDDPDEALVIVAMKDADTGRTQNVYVRDAAAKSLQERYAAIEERRATFEAQLAAERAAVDADAIAAAHEHLATAESSKE